MEPISKKKTKASKRAKNLVRKCLAEVDTVLVNSAKLYDLCLSIGQADPAKIEIIPNGLPWTIIQQGQKALPYAQRKNKVISVCNLVDDKALDIAVKAFAKLNSDWHYEIIGGGPRRNELERLAKTRGNGKITFSGQRDKDYIIEVLSKAKIYLMPSREEAFGVAYLEALSCGVPIIGTKGQGADYIIENGRHGFLIETDDIEATAEALKKLMHNPETGGKMSDRGQKLVAAKFCLPTIAKQIIEVYRKSLDHAVQANHLI